MPVIKQIKQHSLLLDTHVWIWLMLGDTRLSPAFLKAIDKASNTIYISAISVWEFGMLVEKKRIELEMDCLDWINQALELPNVQLEPITPQIAIQSSRLPGNIHGDPADRILIATAHEKGAVLVTHDKKLLDYGADRFVNVYDPL